MSFVSSREPQTVLTPVASPSLRGAREAPRVLLPHLSLVMRALSAHRMYNITCAVWQQTKRPNGARGSLIVDCELTDDVVERREARGVDIIHQMSVN